MHPFLAKSLSQSQSLYVNKPSVAWLRHSVKTRCTIHSALQETSLTQPKTPSKTDECSSKVYTWYFNGEILVITKVRGTENNLFLIKQGKLQIQAYVLTIFYTITICFGIILHIQMTSNILCLFYWYFPNSPLNFSHKTATSTSHSVCKCPSFCYVWSLKSH